jgi:hypothetical protein
MGVKEFVEGIMADGKLTKEEKQEIDKYLLADGQISEEEREQIATLLTKIATGELQVVD